jgi:hypothetical protein
MVENRRLLIALIAVIILGVVARFGLTSVHTSEEIYYAAVPDELPDFAAQHVYVCPECLEEHNKAYVDLIEHQDAAERLGKYPLYRLEPGPDGRCPIHSDTSLKKTTDIPTDPRVEFGLPEDTEFVTRMYLPKQPERSAFPPTPIEVTIVISSTDKRSIHRAESCLTSQAWHHKRQAYHIAVPIGGDPNNTITVRSLLMWRDFQNEAGQTQRRNLAVLYWYAALPDRVTSSEYRRLALMFYDRLVRGINFRWSYVLVSKSFPPGVSEDAITEELEHFVAQFVELTQVRQRD